ncbi:MAG: hypothetical protein ACAH05_01320 [Methylophilus sp.]|nr:hypothetical protein [Methylophilus sp.]
MLRVIAAFLMAPVLAITFMCVLFGVSAPADTLVVSLMMAYLAYPSVLVIGLPLLWLLYTKQWLGLKTCILTALVCAAIAFAFMLTPLDNQERLQQISAQGLFIFASAMVGGCLFWLIGVRNNQTLKRPGQNGYAAQP